MILIFACSYTSSDCICLSFTLTERGEFVITDGGLLGLLILEFLGTFCQYFGLLFPFRQYHNSSHFLFQQGLVSIFFCLHEKPKLCLQMNLILF